MSKISIKPSSTGTGTFTIEAPNSNYNRNFTLPDESGVVLTNNRQLSFRNKIINGNFDIWQRGTSQTSNGYGSADRWKNVNGGSTKTVSRQSFSVGEQFSSGQPTPTHFSRTVVSSVVGGANFVAKQHLIEGVPTLAGKKATLSLWAKADSSKNIAIEFVQNFGTGGSPSSGVNTIGTRKLALTTIWQRFVVTIDVPSISGKVLGTDGNDYLGLNIWFDAGSNLNSRTDSLGQQSGTFDIAQVQLEEGSVATPFEYRPIGTELALCQRYYQTFGNKVNSVGVQGYTLAANNVSCTVVYPVVMRATPTITLPTWSNINTGGAIGNALNNANFLPVAVATATGVVSSINTSGEPFKLDAEL